MEFDLSEWVGIATSVIKPLFAHWLKGRRLRKTQSKNDYFIITCSGGNIEFEGRFKTSISAEEIFEKLLESTKNESKSENGI